MVLKEVGKEDIVLTDYKYSVCKALAKERISLRYADRDSYLSNLSLLVESNARLGIVDLLGHEVVPCKYIAAIDDYGNVQHKSDYNYKSLHQVGDGPNEVSYYHVKGDNGKWGSIYYSGHEPGITEPQFDSIYTHRLDGVVDNHMTIQKPEKYISDYHWNITNVSIKYIGFRHDHFDPFQNNIQSIFSYA